MATVQQRFRGQSPQASCGTGACVQWWRIELYVTPNGEVVAVTLDQWEW
jgi:hypothetical protein